MKTVLQNLKMTQSKKHASREVLGFYECFIYKERKSKKVNKLKLVKKI